MNDKSVIIMGSQSPALPRGRLMFALDATASRAPTWAIARELQAKMFREAAPIGKLNVQLVYYRGDECRTSKWVSSGEQLAHLMNRINCEAGILKSAASRSTLFARMRRPPSRRWCSSAMRWKKG